MPSPVDPSRRTALADRLKAALLFGTAFAVERNTIDLQGVTWRLASYPRLKPLIRDIEAGEYGPYQETDER